MIVVFKNDVIVKLELGILDIIQYLLLDDAVTK